MIGIGYLVLGKPFCLKSRRKYLNSSLSLNQPLLNILMGAISASFRIIYRTQIKYKLMKALVGTRTPGGRMEGVDKSTELWRNPQLNSSLFWNRNKPFQSLVKLTFPRWSFKRLLLWPWTDATNSSFIKFGWKWPNIGLRIGANTKNVPILKHELVPDICVQIGKGCFSSCGENY